MSFEQWWLARASHMRSVSAASYYEGLVLFSLILDHLDNPNMLEEVAARRWCILNLVLNNNMQWNQARSLLPLASVGSMPTNLVYEMQKYAKSQQELFPSAARLPSSIRGKSDSKGSGSGKGGQKGRAGSGSGTSSSEGSETGSSANRAPNTRRGSTTGTGASSAAGASRG